MFALVVRFDVLADHVNEFDALVAETVAAIADHEPGTLVYVTHTQADQPNVRVFYECYRNHDAFLAHEAAPHTKRFLEQRSRHLAAAPEVWRLDTAAGVVGGARI